MSSLDTGTLVFYCFVGATGLITSIFIALRYVKSCNSPLCSCNQDTALSSQAQVTTPQNSAATGPTSPTSQILQSIPAIISSIAPQQSASTATQPVTGLTARIHNAVSNAMKKSNPTAGNTTTSNLEAGSQQTSSTHGSAPNVTEAAQTALQL